MNHTTRPKSGYEVASCYCFFSIFTEMGKKRNTEDRVDQKRIEMHCFLASIAPVKALSSIVKKNATVASIRQRMKVGWLACSA